MVDVPDEPIDFQRRMLREIHNMVADVRGELREVKTHVIRLDSSLANARKDIALQGEHMAHFEVRFDDLNQSIDRINVRLGLVSA